MKKVISIIIAIAIALTLSVGAFAYSSSTPTNSTPWYGQSTGDDVIIRYGPGTNYDNTGYSLDVGDGVHIIGKSVIDSNWYLVYYNSTWTVGFVYEDYISTFNTYGKTPSSGTANVRADHSTSSNIVLTLGADTYVPYANTYTTGGYTWYEVVYHGTSGWMRSNALNT